MSNAYTFSQAAKYGLDPAKFGGAWGLDKAVETKGPNGETIYQDSSLGPIGLRGYAGSGYLQASAKKPFSHEASEASALPFMFDGGGGTLYTIQLAPGNIDYVKDAAKISYDERIGYYTNQDNYAPTRTTPNSTFKDVLTAAAFAAGAFYGGTALTSAFGEGAAVAGGAAEAGAGAVNYSLSAGGVPSLGATSIGAGQSLSVYGANALAGTGYSAIGSTAAGGFITGAAATSSAWLPAVSDAVSTIKNASSTASTVSKLTAGSAISMPAIKKGTTTMTDYTQGIKLGQTMSGENAPMTSAPIGGGSVLTSGSTLFGMKTSTAIWLGVGILAVVGVLAMSKKGK